MPKHKLQDTQKIFLDLIDEISGLQNGSDNLHIRCYIQENISIINLVISISMREINKIKRMRSKKSIIGAQTKLIHEIKKKLTLTEKYFLNEPLCHSVDYDTWLEAQCDLATD